MKALLRELRPILIYIALGMAFTVLATLATGKRAVINPAYWDGREVPLGNEETK